MSSLLGSLFIIWREFLLSTQHTRCVVQTRTSCSQTLDGTAGYSKLSFVTLLLHVERAGAAVASSLLLLFLFGKQGSGCRVMLSVTSATELDQCSALHLGGTAATRSLCLHDGCLFCSCFLCFLIASQTLTSSNKDDPYMKGNDPDMEGKCFPVSVMVKPMEAKILQEFKGCWDEALKG